MDGMNNEFIDGWYDCYSYSYLVNRHTNNDGQNEKIDISIDRGIKWIGRQRTNNYEQNEQWID